MEHPPAVYTPDRLFGLFGKRLRQSRGDSEPFAAFVDSLEISKNRRPISPLPEEINEILGNVMGKMEKLRDQGSLTRIKIIEVDPGGSPHCRNFELSVGLDHFP